MLPRAIVRPDPPGAGSAPDEPDGRSAAAIVAEDRFGSLALDFVNTRALTRSGIVDALGSYTELRGWLEALEVPGLGELLPSSPPGRRTLMGEARRLRDGLVHAFADVAPGRPMASPTLFELNRALGLARRVELLQSGPSGLSLVVRYSSVHPAGILAPIALSAAELITDVDPSRLRSCDADGCPRWFHDTSKGGRRRWCAMSTCGNRAKAARFRRRQEATPG